MNVYAVNQRASTIVLAMGLFVAVGSASEIYVLDALGRRVVALGSDDGHIKWVFGTGYSPDLAVDPQGERLFVAHTFTREEVPRKLSVIDASTGTIEVTVDNPDNPKWDVSPPFSLMAVSPDGRRLYVVKRLSRRTGDEHFVSTFDVSSRRFLTEWAHVPNCAGILFLGTEDVDQVYVGCPGTNSVHILTIGDDGGLVQRSAVQVGEPLKRLSDGRMVPYGGGNTVFQMAHTRIGDKAYALLVFRSSIAKVDLDEQKIVSHIPVPEVGCRPSKHGLTVTVGGGLNLIVPCDLNGERALSVYGVDPLKEVGIAPWSEGSFHLVTADPEGDRLYLTRPSDGDIIVIDTFRMKKIARWRVGGAPALIFPAS